MNIQFVFPAAGLGSRFQNSEFKITKPLIMVNGLPMLVWAILNFKPLPEDQIFVISQKKDNLPTELRPYLSMIRSHIKFVEIDGLTDGPASTVERAFPYLDKKLPLIVANSDQFVSGDLSRYLGDIRSNTATPLILTMIANGPKWSYIRRNPNFPVRVQEVAEKKMISNEATVGIYSWNSPTQLQESINQMKQANDRVNGEFYIAPTYNYLILEGVEVRAMNIGEIDENVHGLGTPEDLRNFLKLNILSPI